MAKNEPIEPNRKPPKVIRNRIYEFADATDQADLKQRRKYIRNIAYWVGVFVIEFNDLEGVMTHILADHISKATDDEWAYIFISGMQFNQKVDLLERNYQYLLSTWDDPYTGAREAIAPLVAREEKLITDLRQLASTRNTIVHSYYYSLDKDGNVLSKVKFTKGNVEQHLVSITKTFLLESVITANDLAAELLDFWSDITEDFTRYK